MLAESGKVGEATIAAEVMTAEAEAIEAHSRSILPPGLPLPQPPPVLLPPSLPLPLPEQRQQRSMSLCQGDGTHKLLPRGVVDSL